MKTIWKYPLFLTGAVQPIELPVGAIVRHVGWQDGANAVCIWAEVDDQADRESVPFFIIGTGHQMPEGNWEYMGTTFQSVFVWHVYRASAPRVESTNE